MTKEDFEKEKESIEQLFFDGTFKETDYFSALNTLQKEYIEYLEMYLKNVQNQCKAQDIVIQKAERKLGQGFWQHPST